MLESKPYELSDLMTKNHEKIIDPLIILGFIASFICL
jgi:hypothetical protein